MLLHFLKPHAHNRHQGVFLPVDCAIGQGFVALVGVRHGDTVEDARYLAQRTVNLRIFPDEQGRMQRRMTDWAKLTPDERKRARDKYKSLQKDTPEKKEAVKLKWQEYKELPESERIRLKAEASQKPTPRPTPSKPAVAPKPPVSSVPPSVTAADQPATR